MMITYSAWVVAERWVNQLFPLGLLGLGFLTTIFGLLPAIYRPQRLTFLLVTIFLTVDAGFGLLAWHNAQRYAWYNEQQTYVTPNVRTVHPELTGLMSYDAQTLNAAAALNNYEDLQQLKLYRATKVTQSVTYLGKWYDSQAVRLKNKVVIFTQAVRYQATGQRAYLTGYRFTLKDPRFKRLGFINPGVIYAARLTLPQSQRSREATDQQVKEHNTLPQFQGWLFKGQH